MSGYPQIALVSKTTRIWTRSDKYKLKTFFLKQLIRFRIDRNESDQILGPCTFGPTLRFDYTLLQHVKTILESRGWTQQEELATGTKKR